MNVHRSAASESPNSFGVETLESLAFCIGFAIQAQSEFGLSVTRLNSRI